MWTTWPAWTPIPTSCALSAEAYRRPATRSRTSSCRRSGYYQRYQAYGFWAAIEKSTGDFLGWFHFRPREGTAPNQVELGYRMRKSAWGKGYATEGSRALIRKGFTESGVQRVTAEAMAANMASRRVMEKAGLTLVRTFSQPWPDVTGGHEIEAVEYALDKADWERQDQGSASAAPQH